MKNQSIYALLISIVFIISIRVSHTSNDREIAWDILGYYMPLPASFVHHDPLLNSTEWLEKLNKEQNLTGTLYMISSNDEGQPMYFFFFGMAILYLPFFFIGHLFALLGGFPMDGFSMPYQYAMVFGAIVYTIIGLFYFRKILRYFFSEGIAALVILVVVFGTNYCHHLSIKDLETVNVLFMLVSIILWYTIQWHDEQKRKYMFIIAAAVGLIALVKPSEVVVLIIPLLWNVYSRSSLNDKRILLKKHKYEIVQSVLIAIVIISPQIVYWLIKTGVPYYDTYKNPGVGLDFFHPHILDSLFSFRKGWLLYTPVMIFFLWGMVILYKKNRKVFYALSVYLAITFYIISSWSEWWYGAGFSNRPIIAAYPVLAIGFGYFLKYISTKKRLFKSIMAGIIICFILFNQFQWWQLRNWILEPYRTTKEYYFATFLKTSVTDAQKELLLIHRDFSGYSTFNDKDKYKSKVILSETFDSISNLSKDSANHYLIAHNNDEFIFTQRIKYASITHKDHIWIKVTFRCRNKNTQKDQFPLLVITMDRKEGNYGYRTFKIDSMQNQEAWATYSFEYLSPEIRDVDDFLFMYFWNWKQNDFDIDDFKITIYEKIPIATP